MQVLENGFDDVTTVLALPKPYRYRLRTTYGVEGLNQEIRRRERVSRIFSNEDSVVRLIDAVLMEMDEKWSTGHSYLSMEDINFGVNNSREDLYMKWVKRERPLSDEEIIKLDKQLGVKFPNDFVKWYKQYEDPEGDNVWVNFDSGPEDIAEFYPPDHFVDQMNLFFEGEEEEYRAYGTVVPFAYSSALNKYCFFYPKGKEEPSGVFFAPKDDALSEVFESNDIKESLYISRTFQGFLDKLYIEDDY
jgi:hypothetical protein